jgi:geranylgeranyl diphosphate synthase type II
MKNFDLKAYLEDRQQTVTSWLADFAGRRFDPENRLCQAMAYSLMAGGKRLRPILAISTAEALGREHDETILSFGCAIEMIHTYSLIHDDLPAMDDDVLRRGRPTCHVRFDEATAILAGDGLLTLAFETMARSCLTNPAGVTAMLRVAEASGFQGMIEGQMRDIEAEGKELTTVALRQMHGYKTGALIEASVLAGALLAGGTDAQVAALSKFAQHIGLAFQVADDILNIEGDPDEMGKAAGTDSDRGKSTYPALMGISGSKDFARELVNDALQALAVFDNKAEPLRTLAAYVIDRRK